MTSNPEDMVNAAVTVPVEEGIKAAAYALGIPSDRLVGYIVIGALPDDEYLIGGNACCAAHVCAILNEVSALTLRGIAADGLGVGFAE